MRMVILSERELRRFEVLTQLCEGALTTSEAARLMEVSVRQAFRLKKRFLQGGALALMHQSRGRHSNRCFDETQRTRIMRLVHQHYSDFGPTLAAEMLLERHGLKVSRECLRGWMIEAELWKPRKLRKRIQQPRLRRDYYGELVQIDGSEHRWFENRSDKCTLLVCVDDATSALMALRFVPSESTQSYFEVLRDYLETHGRPVAFYSDKHSVFRVNAKNAKGGMGMTQFGRALQELNIEAIYADTPAAKGRVERANQTLQDRLVKALRLEGISTIEKANAFLPRFIQSYNTKFAKTPFYDEDRHRPLGRQCYQLDDILSVRETRCLSHALTFNYNRKKYMLKVDPFTQVLAGKYVEIYERAGAPLSIRYQNCELTYTVFDKEQRVSDQSIVENKRLSDVLRYIQAEQNQRQAGKMRVKTISERTNYQPKARDPEQYYRRSKSQTFSPNPDNS